MTKSIYLGALAALLLASCGGSTENTSETAPVEVKKYCFKFDKESTTINWTAYKTTELIGVSGEFKEFTISGTDSAEAPLDVLKSASIEIPVSGIFSKNPGRDERIRNFFFGEMSETDALTGKVKTLNDDGTGVFELTMNGVTNDVPVEYSAKGSTFTFTSKLNLEDYQAKGAVDALNEE